ERFLAALMVSEPAALEFFRRDAREVELQRLADHDVLPEAQAVEIAQPLRADLEPIGIVAERLERLHGDRAARYRVVARIGGEIGLVARENVRVERRLGVDFGRR